MHTQRQIYIIFPARFPSNHLFYYHLCIWKNSQNEGVIFWDIRRLKGHRDAQSTQTADKKKGSVYGLITHWAPNVRKIYLRHVSRDKLKEHKKHTSHFLIRTLLLNFSLRIQFRDAGILCLHHAHTADPLDLSRLIRRLTNRLCNMFLHWIEHWRTRVKETGSWEMMETQMKGLKAEDMTQLILTTGLKDPVLMKKRIQPSIPWPFSCFIVFQHWITQRM